MSVSLTPVDAFNVGILGLGNEGANVLSLLNIPSHWKVDCQLWDSCRNTLSSFPEGTSYETKVLGVGIAHGLGCVGQYELGRSIFLNDQESCRSWLEGKSFVVLTGSLGGGFAGGFAPEFARLAKNMGIPCLMYAKLPFSFEGRKRIESSKQALGKLREWCLSVPMFEGDDYLNWIDDDGFAQSAVQASSKDCALAIKSLVHLLIEDGVYDFDLATIHATFDLDVSKTLVISESSEAEDCVDNVLESVLEKIGQKLPDREVKIDRLLVGLIGGNGLPIADVSRINRTITDRFSNPGKTYFGACIDDEMTGVSIVVYLSIHLGKQFELVEMDTHPSKPHTSTRRKKETTTKKSGDRKKRKADSSNQDEPQEFFDSILNESNRGYFDDTPSNSWNGIDLDVPTYIRRGIRVKT